MATESNLTHDGCNNTANVDCSTGMLGAQSTGQFLAVKMAGPRQITPATTGGEIIYGILQNKPISGAVADVGIAGSSKAVAGAAITAPAMLMTDTSGRLITATGTNHRVAYAIESAAAAGVIFTVAIAAGAGPTST